MVPAQERALALRAQERGPALRAGELRKAAPGPVALVLAAVLVKAVRAPVAVCQDKALASGSDLVDQVEISLAAVQTLANSTASSTLDQQPARLEPAAGSERALPDVRVLRRCQAARDAPAAQRPTSCKTAQYRSSRLAVRIVPA